MASKNIEALLGDKAEYLLNHTSTTFTKEQIHLPGADFVDRLFINTNRNQKVLNNLQRYTEAAD